MGNKAVHEAKPYSEEIISLAFDVVVHLLEGVYILPQETNVITKNNA